jgi:hypothetical protein
MGCGIEPRKIRYRTLAQELVGLQPDIIVTNGFAATAALQRETRAAIMFNPDTAPIMAYMPSLETAAVTQGRANHCARS